MTWEIINEITNHKRRKKTQINYLKDENGEIIQKSIDVANYLNKHFNLIGDKLASKINPPQGANTTCNPPDPLKKSIYMFNTNDNIF